MQLTPLAAAAIQLPLLVAATAALLRGPRIVRWLRVVLLGLTWLILDALVQPFVVSGGGASVVPAVIVAGLLVALVAATSEANRARPLVAPAVAAIIALAVVLLLVPEPVALGAALALWVGGTLSLGWTFSRAARTHTGSLLEARLRLLAGASWLLAAVGLSVLGGPFLIVWAVPMVAGALIIALAVAPPPFVRLALSQTRAAVRRTDIDLAGAGRDDPGALPAAMEGVRAVFGAEAAVLLDDGEVAVQVGDQEAVDDARTWLAGDHATTHGSFPLDARGMADHELVPCESGRWLLAGDTGRGQLVVVLTTVGVLLSRTDREQVDSIAERLGVVLTREEARRADERATASMRAAERMRDDMLSTLSHELRTPLTTIMGFAEVLRKHAGSLSAEQVSEMLDRIVERGMELEMVVSALLDLTAVRGRSEPSRLAAYQLRDLAERAVMRVEDQLGDRVVEVVEEGSGARGVGVVHTDGGAVLAVLEELLENAAQYTPPDATMRVTCSRHGDDVVVEVADDGPGLGELGPAAVFDPFVRGGDVMTRSTSGVGIGLTIARELAAQLGGRLLALDLGTGAAFRLRFPRHHELAPRGTARTPVSAEHAVGDPTLVPSGRRGDVPFPVRGASSVGPTGASGSQRPRDAAPVASDRLATSEVPDP